MKKALVLAVVTTCAVTPTITSVSPAHAAVSPTPSAATPSSTRHTGHAAIGAETNVIDHVVVEQTDQGLRAHVHLRREGFRPSMRLHPQISGDKVYQEYERKSPSSVHGRKFRDQLVCHLATVGYWKNPWNLEAWRPDVGYARTVLAACNPGDEMTVTP